MEMLFILIPLSLGLIAFALWSFVWSVKNDQFDDLERQGWSILFDETTNKKTNDKKDPGKLTQDSESSGDKSDGC